MARKFNVTFYKAFPAGYEDKSGKGKTGMHRTIGTAIENDRDGSFTIFLDSWPLDKDWSGQLKMYEKQDRQPGSDDESGGV